MKEQIEEIAKVTMKHCKIDNQCGSCHWSTCNECLAEVLYNAEYRKQKKGEWIFEFNLDGDDFYKCSVCGRQEVLNGLCNERNIAKHLPYCHCGAKMKGGAK